MTKNELQDKAVALIDEHKNVCLEWATGCGKTLAALRMSRSQEVNRTVLICKESTHRAGWVEEMEKFGFKGLESILYASVHKLEGDIDIMILDEVHALTWNRVRHLEKFVEKGARIIALSATIPDQKRHLLNHLCRYDMKYAKVSLIQAINLKLLPEPRIIVHYVNMDRDQRLGLRKIENKMNYFREQELWEPLKISGLKQKKYLASLKDDKTNFVIDRLRKTKRRFVCFAADINQANMISEDNVISSQYKKRENIAKIREFNRLARKELIAVKMIREGVNLVEIETGLIVQLDSQALSFYQMLGRCLRHEHPEMHMIVVKDSHDEINFDKITKEIKQYIEVYD